MGTGIVELTGMVTLDGHRYFRVYWDGDSRWARVLWSLLEWRHEMGIGILEFIGMETRDGHRYCGAYWNGDTRWHRYFRVYWDGDTRWAQVLWSLLGWRHVLDIGHKFTN
jgi:hypothetical protein